MTPPEDPVTYYQFLEGRRQSLLILRKKHM